MGLKVKSTKLCFYNNRRYRPGQVFELKEGVKPSPDMTVVNEKPAPPAPKAKEPQAFSELNQATVKAEADAMKGKKTGPEVK